MAALRYRDLGRSIAALALALAAGAAHAQAQRAIPAAPAFLSAPEVQASPVLERDGYAVVIDLDENQLHFMRGQTVLWSAPAATGMDLRLQTDERSWSFSTPPGEYQVQFKAENPVWIAPDWYFIENRLPVPPRNDPSRRFPGGLGAAAVYIGHGLAIHGTDKPDLLGQSVSHGCIRLSNDDAQRLFHNVQIGTKVLVVGGADRRATGRLVPGRVPGAGPVDARTERMRQQAKAEREQRLRALKAIPTETLAARLAQELAAGEAGWTHAAGELLRRAAEDHDVGAARGLLESAGAAREATVRAEYATYLVDLSERGGVAMIRALGRLDARRTRLAAGAIVDATVGLYHGRTGDAMLPWPSRRWDAPGLDGERARGFAALQAAERAYRERLAAAPAPSALSGR
jgi:hypothetical protein